MHCFVTNYFRLRMAKAGDELLVLRLEINRAFLAANHALFRFQTADQNSFFSREHVLLYLRDFKWIAWFKFVQKSWLSVKLNLTLRLSLPGRLINHLKVPYLFLIEFLHL